jgi:CRISPR-associated protein Csm4
MDILTLRLTPTSPFGTPMMGDTLFGQLCWSLRNRHGEGELGKWLEGYLEGKPFAVVSDAMPAGHAPRPALPLDRFGDVDPRLRKELKKLGWLPAEALADPASWLEQAVAISDAEIRPQPHNSINRATGTTGRGAFSPYAMSQYWYSEGFSMDCHVVYDTTRIGGAELLQAFQDMGASGFGRDASIGLGRFAVERVQDSWIADATGAISWLTLAPCAPQGLEVDSERSYYAVFTRFGRHGDRGVHAGNPFKAPVLLARAGAVFTPSSFESRPFIGRGLGGSGRLSLSLRETVHQGYAPVVGVALPAREEAS